LNVVRTAHCQTGIASHKILSRSLKLALRSRPRKHAESVQQTNLIPVSSLHVSQYQPKITSSQQLEKNQQTGANTAKPCSTFNEMDRQKKEYYSEWTTVITKKTKHRIGKGDNGILKAAQKPVVLFISRVDPDTTQEEVEKFANIHFQKIKIHCEKLYGSFKVNLQGVEMEDALSPYVWPSGISVKKLFYGRTLSHKKGWNNQHPTTVNNGSKK